MENIFTYGTLQDPSIQQKLVARLIDMTPDSLKGFYQTKVQCNEGVFLILVEDGSQNIIPGQVLQISKTELKTFDEYEGADYRRKKFTLQSGLEAWVYIQ